MPWTLRPHRYRSPDWRSPSADRMRLDGLDLEVARGQVHGYLGPKVGQDDHDQDPARPDRRRRRLRAPRRRPLDRSGAAAPTARVRAGRGGPVAALTGARSSTCWVGCGAGSTPAAATSSSNASSSTHEEGAFLLQEPAEDRARHRPRLRGRAAAARRADRGTRPAHGRCLPQLHRGRAARRPHGAVEPHPRRGRSPVRPRDDHPQRPGRGVRRPLGSSPPDARLGLRRARHRACRARGPPGVHDLLFDGTTVRCHVDPGKLGELLRRVDASGIRTLVSQPPTLEELFLRLYVDGSTEDEGPGSPS